MSFIEVILVDDHPPLREGIAAIISRMEGYRVAASVSTFAEGLALLRSLRPDVALIDVTLPDGNGLDLVRHAAAESPETRCVVVTMHARRQFADRAFEAGAAAYLLKESSGELLLHALEQVMAGERVLDPALGPMGPDDGCAEPEEDNEAGVARLSPREVEVFRLLALGQSGKQVGDTLNISPKTVDNHRARIMEKLCISSIAELVRIAIRTGTIDP